MAENGPIVVALSHVRFLLEWLNNDGYSAAPQVPSAGWLAVHDLLHSPTELETFKEHIRDSVPNTALHLEEIWMKLSLGAVVIVNDNRPSLKLMMWWDGWQV